MYIYIYMNIYQQRWHLKLKYVYTLSAYVQGRAPIIISRVLLHDKFQNPACLCQNIIPARDQNAIYIHIEFGRMENFRFLPQTLHGLLKLVHIATFHLGEFIRFWSGPDTFPSEEMEMFFRSLNPQNRPS